KFFDRLGAHHGNELSRILLLQLTELLLGKELALLQWRLARIDGDVGFEVENALEFPQRHIEQVADATREAFEKPDVRAWAGQLDVTKALASNFREGHFNTTLVAD